MACTGRLHWRQFLRAVLATCAFLLAGSLPAIARASALSVCVQRKVRFDGSTALNYYRVTVEPDTKLFQRLNTTDYQAGHVNPQAPFDEIPESDAVPGFVLLHRVMLKPSAVIQISGPLFKWWYQMGPLDGGNADATPETIKLGGIVAWRYEPPLDINNDGKPINLIVWRGYGLSGAAGRCGEPFIRYTWSMRCQ